MGGEWTTAQSGGPSPCPSPPVPTLHQAEANATEQPGAAEPALDALAALAPLAARVAVDLYPKCFDLPDGPAYRAAFEAKWRARGAARVAFVDSARLHAAVLAFSAETLTPLDAAGGVGRGGAVLVAFRGTDGAYQRLLNRWVVMAPAELPAPPRPRQQRRRRQQQCGAADGTATAAAETVRVHVHSAWWHSLQAALPQLTRAIDAALETLGGDDEQQQQRRPQVFFAGHSLGGAFAQLLAVLLAPRESVRVGGVVAMGAPRVGDAAFAAHYAALLGGRTLCFVNAGDDVPALPPTIPGLLPYAPLPERCLVRVDRSGLEGAVAEAQQQQQHQTAGVGSSTPPLARAASDDGSDLGGALAASAAAPWERSALAGCDSVASVLSCNSIASSGGGAGGDRPPCRCGQGPGAAGAALLRAWFEIGLAIDSAPAAVIGGGYGGGSCGGCGGCGGGSCGPSAAPGGCEDVLLPRACAACGGARPLTPGQRRRWRELAMRHSDLVHVAAVDEWCALRRRWREWREQQRGQQQAQRQRRRQQAAKVPAQRAAW